MQELALVDGRLCLTCILDGDVAEAFTSLSNFYDSLACQDSDIELVSTRILPICWSDIRGCLAFILFRKLAQEASEIMGLDELPPNFEAWLKVLLGAQFAIKY